MNIAYHEFASMGDIADPKEDESIWAWNDRTKNYYPNKCNPQDMNRMWTHCIMKPNTIGEILNSDEWQANQNNNVHIMVWGEVVYFSDIDELVIFKLQFYDKIWAIRHFTRQTFKYVNR